jgi:hypothetical protein
VSKHLSEETKRRISESLKRSHHQKNYQTKEQRLEFSRKGREQFKLNRKLFNETCPWEEKPEHIKRKILLEEQDNSCKICGIKDWNNKSLTLRLDHINGDRDNWSKENLRMICPNCDSQLDTYCNKKGKNQKLISDEEFFKALKESISIHAALKKLKLSPKAGNYSRALKLMNKDKE